MNPFTGGCHYSGNCEKYKSSCGSCPQLGSSIGNDLSLRIFKRKTKAFKNTNLNIVTPSRWLADCVKNSQLLRRFKVSVIPNGLSESIFSQRDKRFSRNLLNLPQDKILILFGAQSTTNTRKGSTYLILQKV